MEVSLGVGVSWCCWVLLKKGATVVIHEILRGKAQKFFVSNTSTLDDRTAEGFSLSKTVKLRKKLGTVRL